MAALMTACQSSEKNETTSAAMRLITLDPGHFHAALVQKSMYDGVDSTVHVYAPDGPDLGLYLDKIETYNTRPDDPTRWKEDVYKGPDYLEKMLAGKRADGAGQDIVVMAGNNRLKTDYIKKTVEAGFNVLADKPMVISAAKFDELKEAFATAKTKNVLLYDIMTERNEITTMLQRAFSQQPDLFGTLRKRHTTEPRCYQRKCSPFLQKRVG